MFGLIRKRPFYPGGVQFDFKGGHIDFKSVYFDENEGLDIRMKAVFHIPRDPCRNRSI